MCCAGGGGGGGGDGDGVDPPHHLALWPLLQAPKQACSESHPGFSLHLPQLQFSSQLYPHAWQVPLGGEGGGDGAGGEGGAGGDGDGGEGGGEGPI